MTKPSDFIMNSDYLSLAQTSSDELTAYFPQATIQGGQPYTTYQDFQVKATPGAIDMFLVSLNGTDYVVGPEYVISDSTAFLNVVAFRNTPSTIRVQLHGYTSYSGGYVMPTQTIKLKISSFKPPNVF